MPFSARNEGPRDREALELLGSTARRARIAWGWTQMQLEDRTEVDQTTISLFERGKVPGLRLAWFIRIATALDLDIAGLAPRERFVVDAVIDALRVEAERVAAPEGSRTTDRPPDDVLCPACRRSIQRDS